MVQLVNELEASYQWAHELETDLHEAIEQCLALDTMLRQSDSELQRAHSPPRLYNCDALDRFACSLRCRACLLSRSPDLYASFDSNRILCTLC